MREERRCIVCGVKLEPKPYYGKDGSFKGYGRTLVKETCSRACTNRARGGGPVDRFWSHVDKSGGPDACWPWMLTRNSGKSGQDYGRVGWEGRNELAHRVAYFLTHGRWPDGDTRHTCDNPPCCNPAHLIDGTTQDNILDMFSKGRARRDGAHNPRAVLTEDQVREIRTLYAAGRLSQREIGEMFGVHQTRVSAIVRRKHWANVD